MKLLIIWLLNLFDYIMTIYYVGKYGIWIEENPLMVNLISLSPILAGIVKILICTVMCALCYIVKDKPIIKFATWGLLLFYFWVAIRHLINI